MIDINCVSVVIYDVKSRSRMISAYESHPICLEKINNGDFLLQHNVSLIRSLGIKRISYIGDYHLEKVIETAPGISVYRGSGEFQSLVEVLKFGISDYSSNLLIVRSDIILNSDLISRVLQEESDVTLGVGNQSILTDFEKNMLSEIEGSRQFFLGISFIKSIIPPDVLRQVLLGMLDLDNGNKFSVSKVDVSSDFETIYPPSQQSRALFGNKAATLENFTPLISGSIIPKIYIVSRDSWLSMREQVILEITDCFTGAVVARSSSSAEDSWSSSCAGEFVSILNIDIRDKKKLATSIDQVFDSYPDADLLGNDVLIQSFVSNVMTSGVVFTRGLENSSPYYYITFDDKTGRTDTVTSGETNNINTMILYREAIGSYPRLKQWQIDLITSIREIETVAGHDAVDIEFAVDADGKVNILQIRPIVKASYDSKVFSDIDFRREHDNAKEIYLDRFEGLLLSDMSDWNPAEMIGSSPRSLQYDLYKYLITSEVWAKARKRIGYAYVADELMVNVLGHPYIIVDNSINSLIPAELDEEICENIYRASKEKLKQNSHLHDKIEFDIVPTCYSPRSDSLIRSLVEYGLNEEYIGEITDVYVKHTDAIISNSRDEFRKSTQKIKVLSDKVNKISKSSTSLPHNKILRVALDVLRDCKHVGLMEFSVAARYGFIAVEYLKGFIQSGIISDDEFTTIVAGVQTVASSLLDDLDALARKELTTEFFVEKYGHLRPSTYDIRSENYKERLNNNSIGFTHIPNSGHEHIESHENILRSKKTLIERFLLQKGFTVGSDELIEFINKSIFYREEYKYEFTKALNLFLELVVQFCQEIDIDRDLASHLELSDLHFLKSKGLSPANCDEVIRRATFRGKQHDIYLLHELPLFFSSVEDLDQFFLRQEQPNFITKLSVQGQVIEIDEEITVDANELNGKIVLIRSADPGFDWIFSTNLLALITMYGGAASHMAIRCAELTIPAAIGVGRAIYDQVCSNKSRIHLDCEREVIEFEK